MEENIDPVQMGHMRQSFWLLDICPLTSHWNFGEKLVPETPSLWDCLPGKRRKAAELGIQEKGFLHNPHKNQFSCTWPILKEEPQVGKEGNTFPKPIIGIPKDQNQECCSWVKPKYNADEKG